jgi:hypothetical protein
VYQRVKTSKARRKEGCDRSEEKNASNEEIIMLLRRLERKLHEEGPHRQHPRRARKGRISQDVQTIKDTESDSIRSEILVLFHL